MSSTAITARDITYSFPNKRRGTTDVLSGVTFDVEEGEFVCVMGPSGCGKSTLLSMTAGFLQPDAGELTWRGVPITRPSAQRGVVFQRPQLYPWLDVLGNVLFGPRAMGTGRAAGPAATKLLDEVGLRGFERYRSYELSGGMQHRVALARTLANDPDLLLMDEPFAALDAQTREEMQALLLSVWQRHERTVIFVTHDVEEALLLADRVVVLSKRPARVLETIPVDFPRPRSYELVLEPAFADLRRRVRAFFAHDGTV